MSLNQNLIELTIESLDKDGDGVGFYNSKKIFVKNAYIGELLKVSLYGEKEKYAQGKIEEILIPHKNRQESFCKNECGACVFTSLSYQAELSYKCNEIKKLFSDVICDVNLIEIIGMTDPFRYRNKAIYSCLYNEKNGALDIGLYSRGTHNIVKISECVLEPFWINNLRNKIEEYFKNNKNCQSLAKNIRSVFFRGTDLSKKICFLILQKFDDAIFREFKIFSKDLCEQDVNLYINVNNQKGNRVVGTEVFNSDAESVKDAYIKLNLLGNSFFVDIFSFFQINIEQTEILYSKAIEFLKCDINDNVLDLYCGVGSISLSIAKHVKKVVGIECVKEAVENAKHNAKINNIFNAEFYCGLVEDVLPDLVGNNKIKFSAAILDPARKGCESSIFEVLHKHDIKNIVYISCNPETQHRDIIFAKKYHYNVKKMVLVDMFPHSRHVETVVLLSRNK
ncbi:MAG: 23S rRNA (uracil(1939)-C(5))-methyltransferase RlmD [Succinivibrionaceae bacterium]